MLLKKDITNTLFYYLILYEKCCNRIIYNEKYPFIDVYATPACIRIQYVDKSIMKPNPFSNIYQFTTQSNTHNAESFDVRYPEDKISEIKVP